ncbi:MAG: hypothetical protein JKY65_17310, partial [Planctomycetes bacterium]|nr:hypothetical protein [Planctomycetota bacterium]
ATKPLQPIGSTPTQPVTSNPVVTPVVTQPIAGPVSPIGPPPSAGMVKILKKNP